MILLIIKELLKIPETVDKNVNNVHNLCINKQKTTPLKCRQRTCIDTLQKKTYM